MFYRGKTSTRTWLYLQNITQNIKIMRNTPLKAFATPLKHDKKPEHKHPHEGRRRLDPNRIKGTWTSETNWTSDDEEKTKIFDKVAKLDNKYHTITDKPTNTINEKEFLRKPEKKDRKKDD